MVLKLNKSIGIVFLVLLALVLVPASGWTQERGSQQQMGQSEISADEIVSFAKAQNQVENIPQKYQTRYSNAKDQAQQQKIVEEMNKEMVAAVQKEGLSVERYNEILTAAQNDPALQPRISEVMQSMQ
jgi:poly-D-alanine transfer protein DltD